MKHNINNITGELVLTPESAEDKLLLYHLMNCADLTRFSTYIEVNGVTGVTRDLGIEYDQFSGYQLTYETEQPLKLGSTVREIDIESGKPGSPGRLLNRDRSLIGFCRG